MGSRSAGECVLDVDGFAANEARLAHAPVRHRSQDLLPCPADPVCRAVALTKPSERARTPWYFQRYVPHLPSGGEIVLPISLPARVFKADYDRATLPEELYVPSRY